MPAPEINVRLTADGVQDVVNAFRRVQQEADKTKNQVSLLTQASEQLGDLLPVITIGAMVGKLVELGKASLDSAVDIGRLAEKTGASVGTLSVLAMASHDVGIEQDQLGQGLVRLARNMENATNGNAASQKAFKSLGISMADVKSKNPADMFVEISQKIQQIPEGATRSAVAMQLFGRAGANLIPVMDQIGQADGFEAAKQKAQSLGLYLSDDFVAQAKQGEEAIRNMQDITKGFMTQFVAGFGPEATGAMVDFENTISGNGTSSIKEFGDFTGNVVRGIVNVFLVASQTIAVIFTSLWDGIHTHTVATFDEISTYVKGHAHALMQAAHGDFAGAYVTGQKTDANATAAYDAAQADAFARQKAIWSEYAAKVKHEYTDVPAAAKPTHSGGGSGGSGDGDSDADKEKKLKEFQKLVDARAAYEDTVANGEFQKQKARDQESEATDKARYDAGLETLVAYYNARAARINDEATAEEAVLRKKLDNEEAAAAQLMGKTKAFVANLAQQGPAAVEAAAGTNTQALAMMQKVAQTRAQIDEAEIKRQTELQQNDAARTQAQNQANIRILTDRQRLYELEGNTSAAQKVAIERELTETDELLTRLRVAENQRKAILGVASVNANARNAVSGLSQSGGDAFTNLQTETSAIQNKANAGSISDLASETQIYAIEKQRLPALQSIADKMQDVVDNTELQLLYLTPGTDAYNAQLAVVNNLQKQVDVYSQKVDLLGSKLQTTKTFSVELSNQLYNQGASAFVNFFDSATTGAKTFGAALSDLGKTFEKIIVHMIDQMIVYYALMELVGWVAPNSSLMTSLKTSSPFSGLTGHAGGGYTGNAPANKVAGLVHGQEYVFTAAATKKWGLPMLEAMNAGTVGGIATGSSYASGSSAGGSEGSGPLVEVNIQNGSGQPVSQTQRTGSNGQSIIDIVVGQVASDIAGGGKVGQTIQSTFSLSRKGVIRG